MDEGEPKISAPDTLKTAYLHSPAADTGVNYLCFHTRFNGQFE